MCLQTRVTAMRRRAGRGTSLANEENPERTCCIPFARLFAFAVVCEALEKTQNKRLRNKEKCRLTATGRGSKGSS